MKYCPECGRPLSIPEVEQGNHILCSDCGYEYFAQLKVGAGAIIERDHKLLLLRRSQEPFKDSWNIPAGYVEADESPEEAVIRETREETGLTIGGVNLENVYFFSDDPRGNGILIVYTCKVVAGAVSGSSEGYSPAYFSRENIPDHLAGGGHNQAIARWRASIPK
jgi:ADP-ribose pyrophosphatase YjhB (NUDIX family)